jgi:hypothetical protein
MLKRKFIFIGFVLWLFLHGKVAGAISTSDRLKFTGALDYFSVMNADDTFKDDLASSIDNGSVRSGSVESKAGYGARVGLRYALPKVRETEVGLSIGYVQGPKITDVYSYNGYGVFGRQREIEDHYYRILAEVGRIFHLSQKFGFQITGGIGGCNGKMEVTQTGGDAIVPGNPKVYKYSTSTTGLTWEISPSFLNDMNKVSLEIGARYAHFPKISESNSSTEIKWSSIGFFLGLNF